MSSGRCQERADILSAAVGRTHEESSMKIKKVKAMFLETTCQEMNWTLCQQEASPVGRVQLPFPALHKLFQCVLSFICADYNETSRETLYSSVYFSVCYSETLYSDFPFFTSNGWHSKPSSQVGRASPAPCPFTFQEATRGTSQHTSLCWRAASVINRHVHPLSTNAPCSSLPERAETSG